MPLRRCVAAVTRCRICFRSVTLLATAVLWVWSASSSSGAEYTVERLPLPFSDTLYSPLKKPWLAINNNGQVAASGSHLGGWRFSSGEATLLPGTSPEYSWSGAFGLDSAGNIVGGNFYLPGGFGVLRTAVIWNAGGGVTTLGLHDGWNSVGYAINESGQVVGGSDPWGYEWSQAIYGTLSFASHAFLYDQGTFHDLGSLGGYYSVAYDVNDSGRIVGMSTIGAPSEFFEFQGPTRAAYSDGGTFQDLNSLIGPSTWTLDGATAVNESGEITGWGTVDGQVRAFLYDAGTVHDVGVLPGFDWSIGRGINASGDVVGYAATGELHYYYLNATGDDRAFLYRNGTLHDLNSLIDPASGWVLRGATDINDSGQIVAWGTLDGHEHLGTPFVHLLLLTPVPEPSGLMLGGAGLAALLCFTGMRWRRDQIAAASEITRVRDQSA